MLQGASGACPAAGPALWLATLQALWSAGVITSSRVRDVMGRVDRANYCQGGAAKGCYEDSPMRIGWGVTIRSGALTCVLLALPPACCSLALQPASSGVLLAPTLTLTTLESRAALLTCTPGRSRSWKRC